MTSVLSNIGLCRRAGKLVLGFDSVKESIQNDKAFAVFVTSDISPKTKKEVKFIAEKKSVKVYDLPAKISDIQSLLHKGVAVMAVDDKGLCEMIIKSLNNDKE